MEILEDEQTPLLNTVDTVDTVGTLESTLNTLLPFPSECCFYRVPYELRRGNEEAYTPMVVSIGPFHHSKESLQEMEVQKQRYLKDFLERRPDLNLEYYFRSLEKFEKSARNCYAENIPYSSNAFIKMMLLDGCFIVELFLKGFYPKLRNLDDPLFKSQVMRSGIRRDLVLLENQLPFFILEHLFNLNVELQKSHSFKRLTLHFLGDLICNSHIDRWDRNTMLLANSTYAAKHIVDLYLHCYSPEEVNNSLTNVDRIPNATRPHESGVKFTNATDGSKKCFLDETRIPNATRLHESGVKFTNATGGSEKCFLDVKFTSGNLEIPPIVFDDNTETFLRNLIAFEQVDAGNTQYFSEYACLMDCLIDTPKDVELLRNAGIIDSLLGYDEEVSQSFNKLGRGVVNSSHLYDRHCKEVNKYCDTPWHTWRAKLKTDYFNTPWAIMSVVAAVVLLFFAFVGFACNFLQCKV